MIHGRTPDGHGWELLPHEGGVIVLMERATVAEARIWLRGEVTTIEFWVDGVELPTALAAHLVGHAFGHPTLGARHAVLACLPRDNVVLLHEVLRHLDNARTRDAGPAQLIDGSIRDDSVLLSLPPADGPT